MDKDLWKNNVRPFLKEIESWAKSGATGKEIAIKLNVGYSTFRKYANTHPELADLLKNSEHYRKKVINKALLENQSKALTEKATPLITYTVDANKRPDQNGPHRKVFERNKKRVYATENECGICGKPVDFKLKHPHPLSPCIDHIIPVSKGGHPSDISNMQLAHLTCNRSKSDKININNNNQKAVTSNRILPHSMDWTKYKS